MHIYILVIIPTFGLIGAWYTPLRLKTAVWFIVYAHTTGLGTYLSLVRNVVDGTNFQGITAGYHRLWAHRSYQPTRALEYFLAALGAGSVEGSISWWARGHRAHHRYTDTDLDPYDARKGLFYSHMGWMLFKPRRKPGPADVGDLHSNPVVKWQHKHYLLLAFIMAIVVPTSVAGYGWGDWQGGFVWASLLRLSFVQNVSFLSSSELEDKSDAYLVHVLC